MQAYCVVYRTGGTVNFKWRRTMPYATREEAQAALADVQRMGYRAYMVNHAQSLSIGLPEIFKVQT